MMERINPPTVSRPPDAPFLLGTPAFRNVTMSSPPSDAGAALPMAMEAELTLPLARQTPPRSDGSNGPNSDSRPNPNLNRRREKPQLSCHLCRRRKSVCPWVFCQTLAASPPPPPPSPPTTVPFARLHTLLDHLGSGCVAIASIHVRAAPRVVCRAPTPAAPQRPAPCPSRLPCTTESSSLSAWSCLSCQGLFQTPAPWPVPPRTRAHLPPTPLTCHRLLALSQVK